MNTALDGGENVDLYTTKVGQSVPLDAVQEFSIQQNSVDAEFGHSAGGIAIVTMKSGTNTVKGSAYYFGRSPSLNAMSDRAVHIHNNNPYWNAGATLGVPLQKNKLFLFAVFERINSTQSSAGYYTLPTALERQGDFSQSTDQLGAPYPYIKDPLKAGTCNASNQAPCYADGGVLGRIPAASLYPTGLNILKWWPEPNCPAACPGWTPTSAYNWQSTYPSVKLLGWQPVIRLDYAPTQKLRGNFKETPALPFTTLWAKDLVGEIRTRVFGIAAIWVTYVISAATEL